MANTLPSYQPSPDPEPAQPIHDQEPHPGIRWKWLGFVLLLASLAISGYQVRTKLIEARRRAEKIVCESNLRNLGLACRIYAVDHTNRFPDSWLQITNSIGSPRLFFCGSDTRLSLKGMAVGDAAVQGTYRYEAAGASEEDLGRIISVCPFHGHVLLMDGSVLDLARPVVDADFELRDGSRRLR